MAKKTEWRTGRADMQSYTGAGQPFTNIYADDPTPEIHGPSGLPLPEVVAMVFGADNKARARLMACAPEMRTLLEDLIHGVQENTDNLWPEHETRARALLARLKA